MPPALRKTGNAACIVQTCSGKWLTFLEIAFNFKAFSFSKLVWRLVFKKKKKPSFFELCKCMYLQPLRRIVANTRKIRNSINTVFKSRFDCTYYLVKCKLNQKSYVTKDVSTLVCTLFAQWLMLHMSTYLYNWKRRAQFQTWRGLMKSLITK